MRFAESGFRERSDVGRRLSVRGFARPRYLASFSALLAVLTLTRLRQGVSCRSASHSAGPALGRRSRLGRLPRSAHDARTAAVRDNGKELASMHVEASRLSSFSGRARLEALRRRAGGEGEGRRQG